MSSFFTANSRPESLFLKKAARPKLRPDKTRVTLAANRLK